MEERLSQLNKLYHNAHTILESDSTKSKYAFLAHNNILEAKYLSVNDLITTETKLSPYIAEHGKVILFPSIVNGVIDNIVARPIETAGRPLTLVKGKLPFYIGTLPDNFKFGDPIILVEGIADVGGLKLIDKSLNIIAMNSSALPQCYYEVIASVTNNIILFADNDEVGINSANKVKRIFKKHNVDVEIVNQYGDFKDTGDIISLVMKYIETKDETVKQELELVKKYYSTIINTVYRR